VTFWMTRENKFMTAGKALTEDGLRLLVACMTKIFMVTGEWDYVKCAQLLREHGMDITAQRVEREWMSPGRMEIESQVEQYREAHLKLMEDRLKYEILRAGIDIVSKREGDHWASEVKHLAVAKAKLEGEASRYKAPQILPITLKKIEVFQPQAPVQPPVLEAQRVESGADKKDASPGS